METASWLQADEHRRRFLRVYVLTVYGVWPWLRAAIVPLSLLLAVPLLLTTPLLLAGPLLLARPGIQSLPRHFR